MRTDNRAIAASCLVMNPALIGCLQSPSQARTITDVADWWRVWQSLDSRAGGPAALAIAGGFAADRVGWAFASGYQAALRALLPELPHDTLAALCVTEAEGNRPRDIRTTIAPQPDGTLRIDGAKRWTTLGPASTLLLVVGALPAPPGDPAACCDWHACRCRHRAWCCSRCRRPASCPRCRTRNC